MPQQIVYSANTMDFWRLSINALVANINFATSNSFNVSGNVIIRGSSATTVALNVANGQISGNGYLLFSLNALSFIGTANNSRLQNTSFSIPTQLGLSGNITTVSLGQTVSLNLVSVNSITNTRTDLPASANSVQWSMAVANTNIVNVTLISTGILPTTRGGTGVGATFSNGEVLIGNTMSGGLDKSSITAGLGISLTAGASSLRANLNITSGNRINVATPTGSGSFIISANGYEAGTTSQEGLISLVDSFNSLSTTQGVTANAVNALYKVAIANPGISNAYGRLLAKNVYTTSNFSGTYSPTVGNTRYTWNKDANAAFVKIIAVGPGGSTGNCGACTSTSRVEVSGGGGAGAVITGIWSAADFGTSETVQVAGGMWFVSRGLSENPDYTGFVNGQVKAYGGPAGDFFTIPDTWQAATSEHGDVTYFAADDDNSNATNSAPFFVTPTICRAVQGMGATIWTDSASAPTIKAGDGASNQYGRGGLGAILRGVSTGSSANTIPPSGFGSGAGGSIVFGSGNGSSYIANSVNGRPGLLIVEQYSLI